MHGTPQRTRNPQKVSSVRLQSSAIAAAAMLAAACDTRSNRPDVYLIIVDTLSAGHLGAYGYPHPTSPEIDALAARSVVFEQAFSTAPWTLPSAATMLTGHHPYVLGLRKKTVKIPKQAITLGELYRADGYDTAAVVSHIYLQEKYGLLQGIETIDDEEEQDHHTRISSPGVTDRALRIVADHQRNAADNPLFMVIHYFDPHYEYYLHPEVYNEFPDYTGPIQSGVSTSDMLEIVKVEEGREDALRSLTNLYDSEIRFTSLHIGRLLDGLEAAGRADNALIVLVGDHGEELGRRKSRWIGHTKVVSDEVVHVPLIMKLPGGEQPRARISETVSYIDLFPTIAAQSGLELPADLDIPGQAWDLSSSDRYRRTMFAESGRIKAVQMARTSRWKMVVYPGRPATQSELYDLQADPAETVNVIKENPAVATLMNDRIDLWNTDLDVRRGRFSPSVEEPTLSDEQTQALREMGYIE